MIINRKEIIELAKKFMKICDENKIWYALDGETLLGAKRHGGFLPWHERFDVMISIDGYLALKRLFPNNIVDSHSDPDYSLLNLVFVEDKNDWKKPQPFIYIRVAVPTTLKKMKYFLSFRQKVFRIFKNKRDNIKHAIDDLYEPNNFQGYFLLESRNSKIYNHWIQVLTHRVKKHPFLDFSTKVPVEIERILKFWYGKDYLKNFKVPSTWKSYFSPSKIEKES